MSDAAVSDADPLASARRSLRGVSWFLDVDDASLEGLLDRGRLRRHARGQHVFRTRDDSGDVWLIVDGFVTTGASESDGRVYLSNWFGRGAMLNVVAALDRQPAIHDCLARTDVVSLDIPGDAFRDLLGRHPPVHDRIIHHLCARIRLLQLHASETALSTLRSRLARVLVDLAQSHGDPGADGIVIGIAVTQESLGEMLGCTRQSVNKELRRFEGEALVRMTRTSYALIDPSALDAIARPRPDSRSGA